MANRIDEILGTTTTLILIPAYGRNYYTKSEVEDAWCFGMDFKIVNGPYTSIRDLYMLERDYDNIIIKYGKQYSQTYLI